MMLRHSTGRFALLFVGAVMAIATPAAAADLGPGAYAAPAVQPLPPPPGKWEFSFTPYGWFSGINGNATARGHTVNVDESFIEILQAAFRSPR